MYVDIGAKRLTILVPSLPLWSFISVVKYYCEVSFSNGFFPFPEQCSSFTIPLNHPQKMKKNDINQNEKLFSDSKNLQTTMWLFEWSHFRISFRLKS